MQEKQFSNSYHESFFSNFPHPVTLLNCNLCMIAPPSPACFNAFDHFMLKAGHLIDVAWLYCFALIMLAVLE